MVPGLRWSQIIDVRRHHPLFICHDRRSRLDRFKVITLARRRYCSRPSCSSLDLNNAPLVVATRIYLKEYWRVRPLWFVMVTEVWYHRHGGHCSPGPSPGVKSLSPATHLSSVDLVLAGLISFFRLRMRGISRRSVIASADRVTFEHLPHKACAGDDNAQNLAFGP